MMQKIDYIIENAVRADAKRISEIEELCFSSPWSENEIAKETEKNNVIFLCAKFNGNILGYVSGQMILDEFYISNIAVDSNYRNCGIGTALLETLICNVLSKNCVFVTLEVRESNLPARKLYEKLGFIDLGKRKNFYSHPTEDAHIYTLYFNNAG